MGSNQSARKLTISNEEVGVIKVSNAVVQRLAYASKNQSTEPVEEVRPVTPPQKPVTKTPQPPSGDLGPGYPVFYYPELTLTALEIQQQKEKELLTQQQYWQKRLQNMERNHKKIDRIIEEEYARAVNSLCPDGTGKTGERIQSLQPCLKNSDKVLKCYQENPNETLKCATLVQEFSNCVDQCRTQMVSAH